ncbi:hypothetical protein L9F63_011732, partial [Diploptera punctata]
EETRENVTVSDLSFVPTTDDDGKAITCRAENPNITGAFLEDSWKIEVVFPPIVSLMLGSTLNPDDIKEGDDVYFECHVKANPGWRKLTWLHNWRLPMNENFTFDVNITSINPMFQQIDRSHFTCLISVVSETCKMWDTLPRSESGRTPAYSTDKTEVSSRFADISRNFNFIFCLRVWR